MTDNDNAPTVGDGGENAHNYPAAGGYGSGDPHTAYREQAAAHFADTPDRGGQSTPPGARAPRLFRPADDATQSTSGDDSLTAQHPAPGAPSSQGLPPYSGQRFGAGTTYTGSGSYEPTQPSSSPYAPPPTRPVAQPPTPAPPLDYPDYQTPPVYGTPRPPSYNPSQSPQPSYYPSQSPPALPVLWQRLTGAIDRLLMRGANGELLRQPWFDSIRAQSADNFVYFSYGGAFLLSLILALATSSALTNLLLCVLWAGLGYLYIALSTRLSRQFLEYGICLVGVIVSVIGVLAAMSVMTTGGLVPGYPSAVGAAVFELLLSVATGFLFGVVGLRVHQAGPLPAPGPGLSAHSPNQFTTPPAPGPSGASSPNAPWAPPGYGPGPTATPGAAPPPPGGGPQIPYQSSGPVFVPAMYSGGGTAITAVVLSFIGAAWNGFVAIGAVEILFGFGQLINMFHQFGTTPGWPLFAVFAMSVAQALVPLFLLVGGIQLAGRRLSGRRTIAIGCFLSLVVSGIGFLEFFGVSQWLNLFSNGIGRPSSFAITSQFVKAGAWAVGLPALFALITMFCALSASTRLWCRPPGAGPYGTMWYGPPQS